MDAYHQKNLGSIRLGIIAPHIGEIYVKKLTSLQRCVRTM